ncbi:DUF1573 domain-containing protein [Candidatus Peregrinibacteria bacterium]|nr:DUF1573 domain-containing protein [Candidatus Peregrinibacteria bacterium]
MNKTNVTVVIIIILVMSGIIWFTQPDSKKNDPVSVSSGGTLIADGDSSYDFGTISMAKGKVSYIFKIKNTGTEAVTVRKLYTSCMCTTASLIIAGGQQFGPYGMPSMSFIPEIDQVMSPAEEGTVEVIFDPAAHGPAGVGKIQRTVTVENNAENPVLFSFSAFVTP